MGTRAITIIKERCGDNVETYLRMYRQSDGYPDKHGVELVDFLKKPVVNGFESQDTDAFNGVGCLAAQVVAHFKDGIGNIYLEPIDDEIDSMTDYTYVVTIEYPKDSDRKPGLENVKKLLDVYMFDDPVYFGDVESFTADSVKV